MENYRAIVQEREGRYLLRNEVVHHIDGDRRNNDPDNLLLMNRGEHSRLHANGRKIGPRMPESRKAELLNAVRRQLGELLASQYSGRGGAEALANEIGVSAQMIAWWGRRSLPSYENRQALQALWERHNTP